MHFLGKCADMADKSGLVLAWVNGETWQYLNASGLPAGRINEWLTK